MKTVVIDDVEYEEYGRVIFEDGELRVSLRPIPKPKKTLVQLAAEYMGWSEKIYREEHKAFSLSLDAIEERLKALEQK